MPSLSNPMTEYDWSLLVSAVDKIIPGNHSRFLVVALNFASPVVAISRGILGFAKGGPKFIAPMSNHSKRSAQDLLPRVNSRTDTLRRMGPALVGMKNPHRYHILDVNGRAGDHRALIREGQDILKRYDIDPQQGIENLVRAPNKGACKSCAQALVDNLRAAQQAGYNRDAIVEILGDHGRRAAGR